MRVYFAQNDMVGEDSLAGGDVDASGGVHGSRGLKSSSGWGRTKSIACSLDIVRSGSCASFCVFGEIIVPQ